MISSIAAPATAEPIFALPVPTTARDLIDEALNAVMEKTHADRAVGPVGKCHEYAIVGARVLTLLLAHPYEAVAGGEIIDCGQGQYAVIYPSREERRKARHLSEMSQFHCWIQSTYQVDGQARLEIVDFTARHDGEFAQALGIAVHRTVTERYLWAWSDELHVPEMLLDHPAMRDSKKQLMWADDDCTRLLRQVERERDGYFASLTAQVLNRLVDGLEALMHYP